MNVRPLFVPAARSPVRAPAANVPVSGPNASVVTVEPSESDRTRSCVPVSKTRSDPPPAPVATRSPSGLKLAASTGPPPPSRIARTWRSLSELRSASSTELRIASLAKLDDSSLSDAVSDASRLRSGSTESFAAAVATSASIRFRNASRR
jgi:hypothetical protein